MPMRRQNVAAALKYLQDKADLRGRFERATSLDPQEQDLVDIGAETAASFIPGVGPALAARDFERARRADDEVGMGLAAASAVPGGRLAGLLKRYDPTRLELDVYQGSPHRYAPTENNPLGELDSSKIGTGEGAQAYGYGHYLAENPEVAEGYRVGTAFAQKPNRDIAEMLYSQKSGDADAAIVSLKAEIKQIEKQGMPVGYREQYDSALRKLEEFKVNPPKIGHVYKADLPDEMIDRMLDWDKPLSQQPFKIQQAIYSDMVDAGYGKAVVNDLLNRKTGMEFFNELHRGLQQGNSNAINLAKRLNLGEQEMFMEASPLASEVMKRMGIPGIKYLDAGSRGQGGAGTRNFVVFPGEEKKVRILERK